MAEKKKTLVASYLRKVGVPREGIKRTIIVRGYKKTSATKKK
jgi:hypothetical protein